MDVIERLTTTLEQRRGADPEASYVAKLYRDGLDRILRKVAEECTETVLAAKDHAGAGRDDALIGEVADLWFHTMVLLVHLEQKPGWVIEELERRFGSSGHVEKSRRAEKPQRPASRNP